MTAKQTRQRDDAAKERKAAAERAVEWATSSAPAEEAAPERPRCVAHGAARSRDTPRLTPPTPGSLVVTLDEPTPMQAAAGITRMSFQGFNPKIEVRGARLRRPGHHA